MDANRLAILLWPIMGVIGVAIAFTYHQPILSLATVPLFVGAIFLWRRSGQVNPNERRNQPASDDDDL